MPRFNTSNVSAPTNKDGEVIALPSERPATRSFDLITPDFYIAVVRGVEYGSYFAGYKGFTNPARPDGKWEYSKITPDLQLQNDNRTVINRQELTLGVIHEGTFIRPDGDTKQSPIFGGNTGAQHFLTAVGMYAKNSDDKVVLGHPEYGFDPELIEDRVITVKTGIAGYIKGSKGIDHLEFDRIMRERNGGAWTVEDLPDLLEDYNREHNYGDGEGLKTKNVITGYYSIFRAEAEKQGFFFDEETGAVYLSKASYDAYIGNLRDGGSDNADPFANW